MKILITGGTGLIGSALTKALLYKGHEITIHTRSEKKARSEFGDKVDVNTSLDQPDVLDPYDAIVNLAGQSIAGGRWTDEQKKRLIDSRMTITQKLVDRIKSSSNPPTVFVSGSAVGYYGSQEDKIITEDSQPHDEFTYQLCRDWEAAALEAQSDNTRVCLSRTGIVLSPDGGMLPKMAIPFKLGLGAVMGDGEQYISWVHINDMVNALIFLLENNNAQGAFNMTAPTPVSNKIFSDSLATALHRPRFFKIPSFLISAPLGEASTMILDGQKALPEKLLSLGYVFSYKQIDEALQDIYGK